MHIATDPDCQVPTVHVVDDDPALRKALSRVLQLHGWRVRSFDSSEAFLDVCDDSASGCLLLDVQLPGLDGLALQQRLIEARISLPIVFLSGHGDIPTSVRALKAGAHDFLTKPVAAADLLTAVSQATARHAAASQQHGELDALRQRYDGLTEREREVLSALCKGRLNKQIASDLGIVEQTVKFHRARIMERMGAATVAELMYQSARLALLSQEPASVSDSASISASALRPTSREH
jgi:FixJ family two-component response regulator